MQTTLRTYRRRAGWYYTVDMVWQIKREYSIFGGRCWKVSVKYVGQDYYSPCGQTKTLAAARAYIQQRLGLERC
jgi:hypothetical protein